MANEKMATLAALHNPYMTVGGKDSIEDFGDGNINSRIGAQRNSGTNSRLNELDAPAKNIPEAHRHATPTNAKLTRCM